MDNDRALADMLAELVADLDATDRRAAMAERPRSGLSVPTGCLAGSPVLRDPSMARAV